MSILPLVFTIFSYILEIFYGVVFDKMTKKCSLNCAVFVRKSI